MKGAQFWWRFSWNAVLAAGIAGLAFSLAGCASVAGRAGGGTAYDQACEADKVLLYKLFDGGTWIGDDGARVYDISPSYASIVGLGHTSPLDLYLLAEVRVLQGA